MAELPPKSPKPSPSPSEPPAKPDQPSAERRFVQRSGGRTQNPARIATRLTTSSVFTPRLMTQLQDYFWFLAEDDIRVQGTRIGIEHILYEYIHNSKSAEAIAELFATLTLEQVYATILYYLQNQQSVGQYLSDWLDYTLEAEAEQDKNPDAIVDRLKQLKTSGVVA